ncbi:MAG: hypothetical protein Q7S15_00870 [bacterium]|nr:hypothetical protein [bacterium]
MAKKAFKFDPQTQQKLDEIKRELASMTKEQVLRRAVALLKKALAQRQAYELEQQRKKKEYLN